MSSWVLYPLHSSVSVIWKLFSATPLTADRCYSVWSFKSNPGQKIGQHSQMLPNVFCRRPPQQTSLAYWGMCFLWAGTLLYIAYEKQASCQILSCVCIYLDEGSVKGETVSMFKGHALMVTLSQTLSNRECHSQSPVRVKGDTTWKHNAGDTFITGCGSGPVTQTENPFQSVKRITTVNILPHKFAVVLQLAREGRQLLFRGYDLRLTVTKKRNGG